MLIKFGAIVVGGRGKMGGTVFSHNRGGDYAKNNATPVNPRTSFQMASRAALAAFSSGWNALSDEQRATWNEATGNFKRNNVFGDAKELSGKNLYVSLNKELNLTGQSTLDTAPASAPPVIPTRFNAAGLDNKGEFVGTAVGTETGDVLVIRATPPVSAGTSFVKNRLRVVGFGPTVNGQTELSTTATYSDRFADPAVGQKVFVGVYTVSSTGERSPEIITPVIVTEAP